MIFPCMCKICNHVSVFPEMPYLDPAPEGSADSNLFHLACHWVGPLIDGQAVLIRRGFPTDGASIPRLAWSFTYHPFQMPLLPHALEHDALYAAELLPSRAAVDTRFDLSMRLSPSIPWIKRAAIYRAVRIGGGGVWDRHTSETISFARKYTQLLPEDLYQIVCQTRNINLVF